MEVFLYLFWNNGIVLQTRAYPWNLYSVLSEWVFRILVRGCCEEDCASPELVPKFGRERMWGKSVPSKTHPLLFFFTSCFGVVFAETIVSQRRWKWFHAFSLAQPEMDVRFYPAPPANVGSCSLPTDPSCLSPLDYYHSNKVNNTLYSLVHKNDFMSHLSLLCEPCQTQPATFTQCKRMLWTRFIQRALTCFKHTNYTLQKKKKKKCKVSASKVTWARMDWF